MNAERQLRTPDEKRLFLLEKLKEEWDVYPNKGEYLISYIKYYQWMHEAGIDDFEQFRNYMKSLENMGLIMRHQFVNEYA